MPRADIYSQILIRLYMHQKSKNSDKILLNRSRKKQLIEFDQLLFCYTWSFSIKASIIVFEKFMPAFVARAFSQCGILIVFLSGTLS